MRNDCIQSPFINIFVQWVSKEYMFWLTAITFKCSQHFSQNFCCNFWNRLWSETYHEVFVPRLQSTSELCGGNGTRLVDQIHLHTYCVIPQGPSICPFVSETIFFFVPFIVLIGNAFSHKEIDIWGSEVMTYEYRRSGSAFFLDFFNSCVNQRLPWLLGGLYLCLFLWDHR